MMNSNIQRPAGSFVISRDRDFAEGLKSLYESFQQVDKLNIFSDAADILRYGETRDKLFEGLMEDFQKVSSITSLAEAAHNSNVDALHQLLENSAEEMLSESTLGTLNPVVGLSLPMLKRHFITCNMKNVIQTEVPTVPNFKVAIEKRYIEDNDGKKHFLPEAFDNISTIMGTVKKPLSTTPITLPKLGFDLLGAAGVTASENVSVDFHIAKITIEIPDPARATYAGAEVVNLEMANLTIRPDRATNTISYPVEYSRQYKTTSDYDVVKDILTGTINYETGELSLNSIMGKVKSVVVGGTVSPELNLRSASTGWEKQTLEFSIPEGVPMNSGLSKDRIKDTKALYNIDEVAKAISDMNEVLAHVEDIDVLNFLDGSFTRNAGTSIPVSFSLTPTGSFAGTPVQWREQMLKDKLSRLAVKLKTILKTEDVYFAVVGSPSTIRLLKDVNYTYGEKVVGGVKLDYEFGLYEEGTNRFLVTSTQRIADDKIRVYVMPTNDKVFTFKHYKYSQLISNEYRDPKRPNIPSVFVNNRYLTAEAMPVQGQISVTGNDL